MTFCALTFSTGLSETFVIIGRTEKNININTGFIKMIGAVLKLIIFTSMVNRIVSSSRNERVNQQVYDTYLQMFDICTLRHTAHIEAIVQFLPYSAQ